MMLSGHSSGTTSLNKNPDLTIGVETLQEDETEKSENFNRSWLTEA